MEMNFQHTRVHSSFEQIDISTKAEQSQQISNSQQTNLNQLATYFEVIG